MPKATSKAAARNYCFGCGVDNPQSMRLKFTYDAARDRFICRFRLTRRYSGPPGYAHGGIIATILDEAMAKMNRAKQILAVTSQMSVDYLKPVPLNQPLIAESRETKVSGRRRFRAADITNQSGVVLAHATGVFITIDPRRSLGISGDASRRPGQRVKIGAG